MMCDVQTPVYREFPAHAGMNQRFFRRSRGVARVPRTRGDEPAVTRQRDEAQASSPHTRG